ncbi:MAG: N-acetyltransferase family protein [Paracoccaceae bacterium]
MVKQARNLTGWTIRPATAEDAVALTQCIKEAYAPVIARAIALPPVAEGIAREIAQNPVWVAEAKGDILAGLVAHIGDKAFHITNIAVRPSAQGQGICAALMRKAAARARALNFQRLRLNTHADMPENIALYRHLGWREVGRSGDKVEMEKPL